jgi:hypothetical protein
VADPITNRNSSETTISCTDMTETKHRFSFRVNYPTQISSSHIPLLRLASVMPVMNYGLFTEEINIEFPVTKSDMSLLTDFLAIFSRDIFINKFVRRKNPYILPEFVPKDGDISEQNAKPLAKINSSSILADTQISDEFDQKSCGVLSSGGKESLLSYAMLKEIGAKVHPLYVNESGGHWRTALPAYRKFLKEDPNTVRVWTNVDRLYLFMLDHMRIIRSNHRNIWSDTYPIRLCIFPVYVFILLPVFESKKIGNLLTGSELDDPRSTSLCKGIKHYFGVYDQTQDFDLRMEKWYRKRMLGMHQWSAVRTISGLVVERILTKRYPDLARVQRSCHSCRSEKGNIAPCGKCSKCQGVLLFLLANQVDPSIMGYRMEDTMALASRVAEGGLRLDEDEREHSIHLAGLDSSLKSETHTHVETIHINELTSDLRLLPLKFRQKLIDLIGNYTKGFTKLEKDSWIPLQVPSIPTGP